MRIIVVGAGLSGLTAARELQSLGHTVTVFDKGRGVGGRLATRRAGNATFDHGAQFFTVRTEEFQAQVDTWLKAGVVREWCRGFESEDGHPRYVGSHGMTSLAKDLATTLDVRTSSLVFSLTQQSNMWIVTTDDGVKHDADAVILTAPLPQSFSLMFSAGVEMPQELRGIDYDRTVGLLVTLATSQHSVPAPGGVQNPNDVFSFIGNNTAKGISGATAITFHANPQWSAQNFDRPLDELGAELLLAAQPWLQGGTVVHREIKKWRFATPQRVWPEPYWIHESGTLALAGDAFNGPKVEGAFLSGLAVARNF
jgi:renalase